MKLYYKTTFIKMVYDIYANIDSDSAGENGLS